MYQHELAAGELMPDELTDVEAIGFTEPGVEEQAEELRRLMEF